jgi:fructokinase
MTFPGERVSARPLVIGESVMDRVRAPNGTVRETPGGSPANVAVGLASLGHPTRFVTQLGDDGTGGLLRHHLASSGVMVEARPTPTGRTSTAEARLDEHGAATYVFDLDFGIEEDDVALDGATHLHIGSVAAILGPAWTILRDLAASARRSAVVTYDVNLRPALTGADAEVRRRVQALAGAADLVKASDEDLAALWPDLGPSAAASELLDEGAAAVIVTLGGSGSLVVTSDGLSLRRPAAAAHVVDTIGAGDSFMSGVIDALTHTALARLDERGWQTVLNHAARCAAFTVSRAGAAMPTRADLGRD